MLRSKVWFPVVAMLLAGCRDVVAPLNENAGPELRDAALGYNITGDVHVLRQGPTAPALETYQVSFWARKNRASSVSIDYLPEAGQTSGGPFLRFDIPRDGLKGDLTDDRFGQRDSVFITMTVDPQLLAVDFQPSGVTFDKRRPARLTMWYGNADRDVNGDGVVNAIDEYCWAAIGLWTRNSGPWHRLYSNANPEEPFIAVDVLHFSQFAVSW